MQTENIKMEFDYIQTLGTKVFTGNLFLKLVGGFLTALMGFIVPIEPFLYLIGGLVVLDFFSGLIASQHRVDENGNREKVQSGKIKRTVVKCAMYAIAILAAHGVHTVLLPQTQVAYFATFFIAYTETQSIFENVEVVTGVDVWTFVKDKITIKKK